MNYLDGYDSDVGGEDSLVPVVVQPSSSAPSAAVVPFRVISGPQLPGQNQSTILVNPKMEVFLAPAVGPVNPFKQSGMVAGARRAGFGHIEAANLEHIAFDEQFKSYERHGFALDCSSNEVLGDYDAYISGQSRKGKQDKTNISVRPAKRQKPRHSMLDIGDDSLGPWAPPTLREEAEALAISNVNAAAAASKEALADGKKADSDGAMEQTDDLNEKGVHIMEPEEEDEKWEKVNERKMSQILPPRPTRGTAVVEATSTFHGLGEGGDYQGRSWTVPPAGLRADDGDHDCYIPKKCVKKWTGHTKGVQSVEFFPGTGHLLLSGSLDGKCKIWDVYNDRQVKRTYSGHSEGVRSIHFCNDGSRFLSSGFDRLARLWDVDTGQAIGTFSNRKMAYQVKFYPNDNNIFLAASSDNRIYQWDVRTGQVNQEYNYHLQPCNTITFFDEGRKFLSTSDDKKLLVWEYDIPVPIKYISEPDMHSIPAVTLHPGGSHFAGQSMDNTIVVYTCGEKVKQLKKKLFQGHNNSGYACQVGFSPNGQFLISGDGLGKLHVWDWKTTKVYRKFQAHDNGPCMGSVWHPLHPNWIATCGWDGLIKLWE